MILGPKVPNPFQKLLLNTLILRTDQERYRLGQLYTSINNQFHSHFSFFGGEGHTFK